MIYILIYSSAWGERDDITNVLSECDLITHWRYDLPNAYYLVSDNNRHEYHDDNSHKQERIFLLH